MSTSRSDRNLILGCRKGEHEAWREVMRRYERLVFSIPLRYGLSREDSADITQLTFTILLQSLDTLRPDSYLGAWLSTVAKRHSWRLVAKRSKESLSDSLEHLEVHASNESEDIDRYLSMHQALARLRARCRDLLRALYFDPDEPGYEELATAFAMPVGSVGPTRARCLKRLKDILQADGW